MDILYTIESTIEGQDCYYNEETGHWWAYWGLSGGSLYSTKQEAREIANCLPRSTTIAAIDASDNHWLYYLQGDVHG
jgi:hypothetical protein